MTLQRDQAELSDAGVDYQATFRVHADADVVFDAVTTTTGLTSWWAHAVGSGNTGGELRLFMHDPEPLVISVDRATRPISVRWTVLACPFLTDWVATRPTFAILPLGAAECEVRFRHQGLTAELECKEMCTRGWNHFLGSLRSYAEVGRGRPVGSEGDRARREAEAWAMRGE